MRVRRVIYFAEGPAGSTLAERGPAATKQFTELLLLRGSVG